MAFNKRIWGLSALVVVALFFMAWLAGLLHFGKIAPGLTPWPARRLPAASSSSRKPRFLAS